ncbi:hypothetical protein ACFX12_021229 [Malus domestica]
MEMESNLVMKNQKLGTSDILRQALIIPARNIKFFIFAILASLPLFCFLIYYEPHLQKIMVETSKILNPPRDADINGYLTYFDLSWSIPIDISRKLNQDFPNELFYLEFLDLVPLHILYLVTAIPIVYLGSKIHTEESPVMTLKDMLYSAVADMVGNNLLCCLSQLRAFRCFVLCRTVLASICRASGNVFGMECGVEHEHCDFDTGGRERNQGVWC